MATLSDTSRRFCKAPNFAVVATVGEDGSPQSTVVWIDTDGENVVFNTKRGPGEGRASRARSAGQRDRHRRRRPLRFLEVQGVASLDDEGAAEHINFLSHKYTGEDFSNLEDRVIVRVKPDRVLTYNVD